MIQAANLASRSVNLANGVVLLLNRKHAHSARAVARALFETCAIAVYTDQRLVPLLEKQRSPKRTSEAFRLLYRLGLGTHPGSETSHIKALPVQSFVRAMGTRADEVMKVDGSAPPAWIGERSFGEAVRHSYSILSEFTHPNSLATNLSQTSDYEWTLQPEVDASLLTATLRPSWLALAAGRLALDRVARVATERPMEFPDADPGLEPDEINPRTRLWE